MQKCSCGGIFAIDAGDSFQGGTYRWYVSCSCDKCGSNIEMDGTDIDGLSDEISEQIKRKEGVYGLNVLTNKLTACFILKKILIDYDKRDTDGDYIYCGTYNQAMWLKNKLVEKGVMERYIEINRVDKEIV